MDSDAGRREERANEILDQSSAVIRGDHFVYISALHGDGWIDKNAIFLHTDRASELCAMLAESVRDRGAEIICAPATTGLIVSQWTAHHLGLPSTFADHGKEHGYHPVEAVGRLGPLRPPFVLKRGYDRAVKDKRVLVVDDVVNTGESMKETVDAVRSCGGEVVTVAALCTRGNAGPEEVGCEDFEYLTEIEIPYWSADDCDLCRKRVPINTRYAHGADYIAAHPDTPHHD